MSQVSCIIPYYNGGDTITRAIDSAITDPQCAEVIVVVDASPDPLEAHLSPAHRTLREHGRLRVIELASNHGQGSARNIGASVALGDLLVFLDQDDMHIDGYMSFAARVLDEHPEAAAVEVWAEFWRDGRIVIDETDPRFHASLSSVPWNIVVRRPAFWASGGFPVSAVFRTLAAGEDIAFKFALKRAFVTLLAKQKFVRHFIRRDSAGDRYLRRTRVVDGRVEFLSSYENEDSGTLGNAVSDHVSRAKRDSLAYLAYAKQPD